MPEPAVTLAWPYCSGVWIGPVVVTSSARPVASRPEPPCSVA